VRKAQETRAQTADMEFLWEAAGRVCVYTSPTEYRRHEKITGFLPKHSNKKLQE